MNPIQEAIARVTGLDEVIDQNQQFSEVIEHIGSQNALLQRQIEDIDYLNLFDLHSITEVVPIGDRKKTLNRLRRLRHENPLAKQSIQLIKRFTLGKGVQIVIGPDPDAKNDGLMDLEPGELDGTGPKVNGLFPGNRPQPDTSLKRKFPQVGEAEDDDQLKKIITDFWRAPENELALTSRDGMQGWLDDVATDGEKFFICFEKAGVSPYVKITEIPLEEIQAIIYDPDNRLMPVYYRRAYQEMIFNGKTDQYEPKAGGPTIKYYLDHRIEKEQLAELRKRLPMPPAKQAPEDQRIFHSMINPLWTKTGRRGISELYSSREWFRVYKEFMEDRAAINAAATSIAYKRKVKGGPTEVARFANKLGNLNVGYDSPENVSEISKLTRPAGAGIYDSNPAVDLEWMKTDTGAINAKEDGRSILTAAGAGTGMFVHYFGDGGDANLATAQAMELPMVKTFEDWQQWVEENLRRLLFYVIRIATDMENAREQIDRVAGVFPPIISQDVVKFTTAWSQVVQNIAPDNHVVQREAIKAGLTIMGVANIDALMSEIEVVQLQAELRKREMEKLALMAPPPNPATGNGTANGAEKGRGAANGAGNAIPSDLQRVAAGKPAPERNGPKPA